MNTVYIAYPVSREEIPAQQRDLIWYNYDTGEMDTYKGSRLDFKHEYNEESKTWQTKPYGVTDIRFEDKTIKDKVMRWFDMYNNYNDTKVNILSSDSRGITIEVPDEEEDDFMDALERTRFKFEIK